MDRSAHIAAHFVEFRRSQCARVIDAIATIYKQETHCKDQQLTAEQRLACHQANSSAVWKISRPGSSNSSKTSWWSQTTVWDSAKLRYTRTK